MQTQISSPFSSLSYEKRWDATEAIYEILTATCMNLLVTLWKWQGATLKLEQLCYSTTTMPFLRICPEVSVARGASTAGGHADSSNHGSHTPSPVKRFCALVD